MLSKNLVLALLLSCSMKTTVWGAEPASTPSGGMAMGLELSACRDNLEVAWREIEALRGQVEALGAARGVSNDETSRARTRDALLMKLRDALVTQRGQMATLEASAGAARAQVEALEAELDAERKEKAALESAGPDRKQAQTIRRLKEDVADLETDLVRARQLSGDGAEKIRDLKKQLKDELLKSRDLTRELERGATDSGARKLRKQVEALDKARKKGDTQVEELATANQEVSHALDLSEKALRRAEREVDDLKAKAAKNRKRIQEQDNLLAERYKELRDLREALSVRNAMQKRAPAARAAVPPPVAAETPLSTRVTAGAKEASPYKLIVDGNKLLRDGETEKAERCFLAALRQDESLMGGRLGMAACYYAKGRVDDASGLVEAVLKDDRKNPTALGLAGIIAWRKGDLRKARRALEKGIKYGPKDAQLYNYAGIVYDASKQDRKAIRALRKAVEIDPEYAEAAFNLAVLLATREPTELDEARTLYEKALSLGSLPDESLETILHP